MGTLGYANSIVSSVDIPLADYKKYSYIQAVDTEKVPQGSLTGLSTVGKMLTYNVKGNHGGD